MRNGQTKHNSHAALRAARDTGVGRISLHLLMNFKQYRRHLADPGILSCKIGESGILSCNGFSKKKSQFRYPGVPKYNVARAKTGKHVSTVCKVGWLVGIKNSIYEFLSSSSLISTFASVPL